MINQASLQRTREDVYAEKMELLKTTPPCNLCDNMGRLSLYRDSSPSYESSYSFQCSCRRGAVLYPTYPKVSYGFLRIKKNNSIQK
jgi:hypothetical protein